MPPSKLQEVVPVLASPRSFSNVQAAAAAIALGVVGASLGLADTASAGGPVVSVLVLREHGVGTSTAAQPYLDQFIQIAGQLNGWDPASKGLYVTDRAKADAFVKSSPPHFGIFTLGAFLALKGTYNLDAIGQAATSGGQRYFMVSTSASDLAGCKGKRLASDHLDDARFGEHIIAAGAFKIADFTLVATKRPGEAANKLLNNDAECALIDDAQLTVLQKSPGGAAAKEVWKSASLPGMVLVAFPAAPAAEKTAFQTSLPKICPTNPQVCSAVQLVSLDANVAPFPALVAAY
jgi:hypothetical protein